MLTTPPPLRSPAGRRPHSRSLRLAALAFGAAARLTALPAPIGSELRVNDNQTGTQNLPKVGMDDDGNFRVVWSSAQEPAEIRQKAITAQNIASSESPVNTFTTGTQRFPVVAMNATGDYIVAWSSVDQFGILSEDDAIGRASTNSGGTLAAEGRLNTAFATDPGDLSVCRHDDGSTSAVWLADGDVVLRRFNAAGAALSVDVPLGASSTPHSPHCAGLPDGETVVAYSAIATDDRDIFFQIFDSNGVRQLDETLANEGTFGFQDEVAVGSDAVGGFVVAWLNFQFVDHVYRFFDRTGQAVTPSRLLHATAFPTGVSRAELAVAPDGAFVAAWAEGETAEDQEVVAREFTRVGVAEPNGTLTVNTTTAGDQQSVDLAVGRDRFVVVWSSDDESLSGVWAQRYRRTVVFADGFEDGSSDYWILGP